MYISLSTARYTYNSCEEIIEIRFWVREMRELYYITKFVLILQQCGAVYSCY